MYRRFINFSSFFFLNFNWILSQRTSWQPFKNIKELQGLTHYKSKWAVSLLIFTKKKSIIEIRQLACVKGFSNEAEIKKLLLILFK